MNKSLFGVYHPAHKFTLLTLDLAGIVFAFFIATNVRLGQIPSYYSLEFLSLCSIIVVSLFIGNGYTSTTIGSQPRLPLNTFFVVLASTVPTTLFIYLLGPERFTFLFGRGIFPVAIVMIGIIAMGNRVLLNHLFKDEQSKNEVLVIGDIQSREYFETENRISLAGINLEYSPNLSSVEHISKYNAIVVSPSHTPSTSEQQTMISARLSGTPIFSLSDFFESFLFLVPVNEINNDWFLQTKGFTMLHSTVSVKVKRGLDVLMALILILISLPLCLLTALLVKTVSKGPALFSQERVGLRGKHFTIYKFRTMRLGSEKNGAQWAKAKDDRVIPFGHFLRATRIDELPQCWNILKGEMSIVGPRPERPEFTDNLAKKIPYYELRHIIKPGLTGWAQVSYPYGASVEDALRKLQYDLYYIKNYSLLLDLNILLRTILVSLRRTGR